MAFNTATYVKVAVAVIVLVIVALVITGPGIIGDTSTVYRKSGMADPLTARTGLSCDATWANNKKQVCTGAHDAAFTVDSEATINTGALANGDVTVTLRPAAASFTGVLPIIKLVPLILVVGLMGAGGAVAYRKYGKRR